MKRVFISLPMSGISDGEVKRNIDKIQQDVIYKDFFRGEEIEFVDNILSKSDHELLDLIDDVKTKNLLYLGAAITKMATVDAVVFGPGWHVAGGCRIEFQVARTYDIPMYFA